MPSCIDIRKTELHKNKERHAYFFGKYGNLLFILMMTIFVNMKLFDLTNTAAHKRKFVKTIREYYGNRMPEAEAEELFKLVIGAHCWRE